MPSRLPDPDLQRLLFDGQAESHESWQRLFSSEAFAFQEGLTHEERIALSYQRLHLVGAAIPDPRALVQDPAALSALHEWAGVADAGMATILSIHYNLFLGSLIDHDHGGRDLSDYLRMERIGTFLCTEKDHGNSAPQLETTATLDRARESSSSTPPTTGPSSGCPTPARSAARRTPWWPPV